MSTLAPFNSNPSITIGIELELQLVDLQFFNLAMEAEDFLRRLSETPHTAVLKPEFTQSMIEINSSVHNTPASLLSEIKNLRNRLVANADETHIGICGGGTHPFARWNEQRIFPTERFTRLSEQYGHLAKQFAVYGQHIHIGCPNGDDALYLCQAMARYIPHFIALAAASPFTQGVDTTFNCSRLTIVSAFPLSGLPPWILNWNEFEDYFDKMVRLDLVQTMKDFYWDIRPKPEFGTVELRICDTPLTVEKAVSLAAYAQLLAAWLLEERVTLNPKSLLTYSVNRFRASRYGLHAVMLDAIKEQHIPLVDDITQTSKNLVKYTEQFNTSDVLADILNSVHLRENDAVWIKNQSLRSPSLSDTVRAQVALWREHV